MHNTDQFKTDAHSASENSLEFLSSIVHELKTPISAIIGFSEVLEDEVKNPKFAEECAYYAREINSASVELLDIVHDLLDIGATNSGIFSVDLSRKIDVVDVVRRAIRLNWDYALKRNVSLDLEVDGQKVETKIIPNSGENIISPIHLDAKRTKQILTNIISNAVKYSPEKTQVIIAVKVAKENADNSQENTITTAQTQPNTTKKPAILEIAIHDHGFGMSEEQLEKLFSKYQTFENPNSGKVDSTGLGLSITKQLVELQGGTIEINSKKGVGTQVVLKFTHQ